MVCDSLPLLASFGFCCWVGIMFCVYWPSEKGQRLHSRLKSSWEAQYPGSSAEACVELARKLLSPTACATPSPETSAQRPAAPEALSLTPVAPEPVRINIVEKLPRDLVSKVFRFAGPRATGNAIAASKQWKADLDHANLWTMMVVDRLPVRGIAVDYSEYVAMPPTFGHEKRLVVGSFWSDMLRRQREAAANPPAPAAAPPAVAPEEDTVASRRRPSPVVGKAAHSDRDTCAHTAATSDAVCSKRALSEDSTLGHEEKHARAAASAGVRRQLCVFALALAVAPSAQLALDPLSYVLGAAAFAGLAFVFTIVVNSKHMHLVCDTTLDALDRLCFLHIIFCCKLLSLLARGPADSLEGLSLLSGGLVTTATALREINVLSIPFWALPISPVVIAFAWKGRHLLPGAISPSLVSGAAVVAQLATAAETRPVAVAGILAWVSTFVVSQLYKGLLAAVSSRGVPKAAALALAVGMSARLLRADAWVPGLLRLAGLSLPSDNLVSIFGTAAALRWAFSDSGRWVLQLAGNLVGTSGIVLLRSLYAVGSGQPANSDFSLTKNHLLWNEAAWQLPGLWACTLVGGAVLGVSSPSAAPILTVGLLSFMLYVFVNHNAEALASHNKLWSVGIYALAMAWLLLADTATVVVPGLRLFALPLAAHLAIAYSPAVAVYGCGAYMLVEVLMPFPSLMAPLLVQQVMTLVLHAAFAAKVVSATLSPFARAIGSLASALSWNVCKEREEQLVVLRHVGIQLIRSISLVALVPLAAQLLLGPSLMWNVLPPTSWLCMDGTKTGSALIHTLTASFSTAWASAM